MTTVPDHRSAGTPSASPSIALPVKAPPAIPARARHKTGSCNAQPLPRHRIQRTEGRTTVHTTNRSSGRARRRHPHRRPPTAVYIPAPMANTAQPEGILSHAAQPSQSVQHPRPAAHNPTNETETPRSEPKLEHIPAFSKNATTGQRTVALQPIEKTQSQSRPFGTSLPWIHAARDPRPRSEFLPSITGGNYCCLQGRSSPSGACLLP